MSTDLYPHIIEDDGLPFVAIHHTHREWAGRQGRATPTPMPEITLAQVVRRMVAWVVALFALMLIAHFSAPAAKAQTIGAHLTTAHVGHVTEPYFVTRTECVTTKKGKNVCTKHREDTERRTHLNGFNPGLYVRIDEGQLEGLTLGLYRNSLGRPSTYAAWTFETESKRYGFTVGAVSGYDRRVEPMFAPSARFGLGDGGFVRLSLLPQRSAVGVHLSLERSL